MFWLELTGAIGIGLVLLAVAYFVVKRPYEFRIARRYLYGGKRDRLMLLCALGSLGMTLMGVVALLTSHGGSPAGVLLVVFGMISTAVFALLATFTVFTSVSVLGVALGVAALTVVLAVTTGFQKQFRDKVLGVNAHVIILKSQSTFANYRDVMDIARNVDKRVVAVQPFIFAEMLATRGKGELSGVAIKGVDPHLVSGVLDLESHMELPVSTPGSPVSIEKLLAPPAPGELPPIIMGKELAHKLKAKLGDDVTVVALSDRDFGSWSNRQSAPRTRKFRVAGIFYSGFDEYDRHLMYTALPETQELVGRGDQVMGVELKVKDVDDAREIAHELQAKLDKLDSSAYQVQDWYELNHNLFTALYLQKLVLVIILTLIIIVAAVNMISALTMMVTDKTREIAILKSMGASSSSVARVFQILGLAIGGVGSVLGVVIGLVTAYVVSGYGYHLDPKVYLIDRLPIEVRWFEVAIVVFATWVISLLSTWAPAQGAAALRPVEGLRYD